MHEDLLGYLLGALEPHEMRRVAELLRDDPEARQQLAEIERSLKPLEEGFRAVPPPPSDLVSRTLDSLPPLPSRPAGDERAADERAGELVPMHSGVEAPRSPAMTWLDWGVGAVAAVVILGLLLPSLAEGRFESRKVACQDQLRQFGTSLARYASRSAADRLPAVNADGREAFAGIYAIRLSEADLLLEPSLRWCPSMDLPNDQQFLPARLNEIATLADLHRASVDRLREIQRTVGGHYAYTLGVIEHDQLASPRFEARSSFAVMSDAPMVGSVEHADLVNRIGHSGAGINVLYEDGRVRFVPIASLDSMPDHPLLNHRGHAEAGVNVDDASLAPSFKPPFVDARQR